MFGGLRAIRFPYLLLPDANEGKCTGLESKSKCIIDNKSLFLLGISVFIPNVEGWTLKLLGA